MAGFDDFIRSRTGGHISIQIPGLPFVPGIPGGIRIGGGGPQRHEDNKDPRDADGNGRVSDNEKKAFKEADKNEDGKLTGNEIDARNKALKVLNKASEPFDVKDADHNREVSDKEKAAFKKADLNEDGKLTGNEIAARDKALKGVAATDIKGGDAKPRAK
jgi:hypothetical protein